MSDEDAFKELVNRSREIAALTTVEELLNWDQRTLMPPKAAPWRAEQITLLSGMIHEKTVDPRRGELLEQLSQDPDLDPQSDQGVIVSRLNRQFQKESRVPKRLVEELSRTRVLAHESWVSARETNEFSLFSGHLEKIVELLREKTAAIGFETCAYDVLLDDYEPDARSEDVRSVFAALRDDLVPLIDRIKGSRRKPDVSLIQRKYDVDQQRKLGVLAADKIGFDFESGRLDVTHHPFCTTLGPNDCRITTRYNEQHFNTAFFGTLHEAGHGLYEQGLRKDQFGLPTGEYCSLGIHESQSRLWENMVGRSLAFWKYFFPVACEYFPAALDDVSVEQFFAAVNFVEPSLIRVEADEATYSLHIIIRFELEQELFAGDLTVNDLPDAWRERYQKYLGICPDTDSEGVLQDVHWSEALFGYFPTYALGNLYAAQFFRAAEASCGSFEELFELGQFQPLLDWLRLNVHEVGKSKTATQILRDATGEELDHRPMIEYLTSKYRQIYDLS